MGNGWDATGLLKAHWGRVGGRDKLAAATGINPALLSSYNTGKQPLGQRNAERIAEALGITVQDLGAPSGLGEPSLRELLERLNPPGSPSREQVADELAAQLESQAELLRNLTQVLAEVVDAVRELREVVVDLREVVGGSRRSGRTRR